MAVLTFSLSYKASAQAQSASLQQAVSNARAGNQSNTSGLNSQAAKISAVNAALSALAPYSQVCSTDLTDASGQPAQFWFACSDQRPGG